LEIEPFSAYNTPKKALLTYKRAFLILIYNIKLEKIVFSNPNQSDFRLKLNS